MTSANSNWIVYILMCSDNTFYTGVTNDLEKRLLQHNQGKGAKYTRARLPVQIAYTEHAPDKGKALKREYEIKQLSRIQKSALIATMNSTVQ